MKKVIVGTVFVMLAGCGGDDGGGSSTQNNDETGGLNAIASGVCGDPIYYPEGDVTRLLSRDADAWHLHEFDTQAEYPNATYDQLRQARSTLDAEVQLFIPLVIDQMVANSQFIASGRVYDEWQVMYEEQAVEYDASVPLYDDVGEIVGLDGFASILYKVPGSCGGEVMVSIGGQQPGLPDVSIRVGQQFDMRNFPLGYNVMYRYQRGTTDDYVFSQTFYTKLGLQRPVINFQAMPETALPADDQRDWDVDYAVTIAMTEAVRQLRTGDI